MKYHPRLPLLKARTRSAGVATIPTESSLNVTDKRGYIGGYDDATVEAIAEQDGAASVNNPTIWGENTQPNNLHVLNGAHATTIELIAHEFRGNLQTVIGRVEQGIAELRHKVIAAKYASDKWKLAMIREIVQRHTILSSGASLPDAREAWKPILALTVLFLGDWALVAVAFQILGLSDTPAIPGIQFTDDLHLASLATIVLLVLLAHGAGVKLRKVEHAFELRRREPDVQTRAKLPKPSWLDVMLMTIFILVAAFAVVGVGEIRLEYLAAHGVAAPGGPFLAVQLGVLAAAIFVAYHFSNPFEKEWKEKRRATQDATRKLDQVWSEADSLVASLNVDIERIASMTSQAGHHVRVDAAQLSRQHGLFRGRVILAQPEPTIERLFAEEGLTPDVLDDDALLKKLTGITKLAEYEKISTEDIAKHHDVSVAKVQSLAEQFEQLEIKRLLCESEPAVEPTAVVSPIFDQESSESGTGVAA
jgi:hypothetical protein